MCTRLAAASNKVDQLLAHDRWFSPGTPSSSTTKTGRHDIAEILLKVALYTKNQINQFIFVVLIPCLWHTVVDLVWVSLFGELKEGGQVSFYSGAQKFSWQPWFQVTPLWLWWYLSCNLHTVYITSVFN